MQTDVVHLYSNCHADIFSLIQRNAYYNVTTGTLKTREWKSQDRQRMESLTSEMELGHWVSDFGRVGSWVSVYDPIFEF